MAGDRTHDVITAVATPTGVGGIAVLRVSGELASSITRKIADFLPVKLESHRIYYGNLRSSDGEVLDEVLVNYFAKGRSFTGEETLEISCHGSPFVAQKILQALIHSGARIADPGEFTMRAFMNGRLDLTQAEAVLDLIQAQSDNSSKQALRQLGGAISRDLQEVEDELTWCLAHLEAGIDFSSEGIEIVSVEELTRRFSLLLKKLLQLKETYKFGRLLKEGVQIALLGLPNVGKSSLLNAMAGEDLAIVTDIPGTTRDVISGEFLIHGLKARVSDTAGLRETLDFVEKEGVSRSRKAAEIADRILYIFDAQKGLQAEDLRELADLNAKSLILVGNKADLLPNPTSSEELEQKLREHLRTVKNFQGVESLTPIFISSFDLSQVRLLKEKIWQSLELKEFTDSTVISRARHFEALEIAAENLQRGAVLIGKGMSNEFIALELKEALMKIQEIMGKRFDDQILDRVFKEFCLGK